MGSPHSGNQASGYWKCISNFDIHKRGIPCGYVGQSRGRGDQLFPSEPNGGDIQHASSHVKNPRAKTLEALVGQRPNHRCSLSGDVTSFSPEPPSQKARSWERTEVQVLATALRQLVFSFWHRWNASPDAMVRAIWKADRFRSCVTAQRRSQILR